MLVTGTAEGDRETLPKHKSKTQNERYRVSFSSVSGVGYTDLNTSRLLSYLGIWVVLSEDAHFTIPTLGILISKRKFLPGWLFTDFCLWSLSFLYLSALFLSRRLFIAENPIGIIRVSIVI